MLLGERVGDEEVDEEKVGEEKVDEEKVDEEKEDEEGLSFLSADRRAQLKAMARRLAMQHSLISQPREAKEDRRKTGSRVDGHRIGGVVKRSRFKPPPIEAKTPEKSREALSKTQVGLRSIFEASSGTNITAFRTI